MNNNEKIKELSAVCGLFCTSCSIYIGTQEDQARLDKLAERMGKDVEELRCSGCRSDQMSFYCKSCEFKSCAAKKGIDFCSECDEYPCSSLKEFQSQMPHRLELWNSLKDIKENGYEKWYEEMIKHYSCPECNTINSAYDINCRKCGNNPGNEFVNRHKDKILGYFNKN